MSADRAYEVGDATLVIRPNRSLPVAGMVVLFAALSGWTLAIGIGFTLAGAWMVLPFAALEVLVVALLCWWFYRHRDDCELITVEPDLVRVIKRRGNVVSRHEFPRFWVRVTLDRQAESVRPTRLLIGSHGRFISVGDETNDGDRELLAVELRRLLQS